MLSGTTTLLSEQKITSPLGTPERNTTATLRQRLTWQTLDHKPLLSKKRKQLPHHTHKILTQSKAEKSDYLWIAFSLCSSLPLPQPPVLLYWGNSLARRQEKFLGKKPFLKYLLLFNNIESEIHSRVFQLIKAYATAFLSLTCLVCIKEYLESVMLTQFYCWEKNMHACKLKTH